MLFFLQRITMNPMDPADRADIDVTALLERWQSGSAQARDAVFAAVYDELRGIARRQLRAERAGHTLQPTALVNEALLRLLSEERSVWRNREHVLSLAAQAMRRVLVDHARRRLAEKRPDPAARVDLEAALAIGVPAAHEVLSLDQLLPQLAQIDPRQAQIVELRFFAGLENEDVARTLGVSLSTVKREWRVARAWLQVAGGLNPTAELTERRCDT